MRLAIVLLLALAVVGCRPKPTSAPAPAPGPAPAPAPADPNKDKVFDFRPTGGSNTVLGKSRDVALDAKTMDLMRQVKLGLDADMAGVPANKEAWIKFLRDYGALRTMVERGEVIAISGVALGDATTVLMYEKRIATDPTAIVLTADGRVHKMTKAQFDSLKKP